jgi:hypothetical protein
MAYHKAGHTHLSLGKFTARFVKKVVFTTVIHEAAVEREDKKRLYRASCELGSSPLRPNLADVLIGDPDVNDHAFRQWHRIGPIQGVQLQAQPLDLQLVAQDRA